MDNLILDDMPPQEPERPRKGGIFTDKTRQALAKALEHHSSHEIGRLKLILTLIWIYRWGYSTPTILDLVVGGDCHGNIASRLLKAGYIETFAIYLGSRFDALPRWITVLTRAFLPLHKRRWSFSTELADSGPAAIHNKRPYRMSVLAR